MNDKQAVSSTREVLAAALCDAVNGSGAHGSLSKQQRINWLFHADRVIHELAERDWMCVSIIEDQQNAE